MPFLTKTMLWMSLSLLASGEALAARGPDPGLYRDDDPAASYLRIPPVSYTHLDVYKRQIRTCPHSDKSSDDNADSDSMAKSTEAGHGVPAPVCDRHKKTAPRERFFIGRPCWVAFATQPTLLLKITLCIQRVRTWLTPFRPH